MKWHPECFGCYMCGAELCENGFFKHNGRYVSLEFLEFLRSRDHFLVQGFKFLPQFLILSSIYACSFDNLFQLLDAFFV